MLVNASLYWIFCPTSNTGFKICFDKFKDLLTTSVAVADDWFGWEAHLLLIVLPSPVASICDVFCTVCLDSCKLITSKSISALKSIDGRFSPVGTLSSVKTSFVLPSANFSTVGIISLSP